MKLKLTFISIAVIAGFALAQEVVVGDPSTWFTSPESVIAIAGIFGTFLVNFLTSLGKGAWLTSGYRTVLLSGVISVLLAVVAGAVGLGAFSQGLVPAVTAVVVAFVGANLKYLYDKQVAESGAKSAAAKTKLLQ